MDERYLVVVEDSDEDFAAIERVFGDTGPRVVRFRNSDEALASLRDAAPSEGRPAVLLIDLNLPGRHGTELVKGVRAQPHLRALPVVMLSGSPRREDVKACYDAGANAYVVKPLAYVELRRLIEGLWTFWSAVRTPDLRAVESAGGYGLL